MIGEGFLILLDDGLDLEVFFSLLVGTLVSFGYSEFRRRKQNKDREIEKLSREIAELKMNNLERVKDLKHDKKKMEKLNEDLAAVLKKATFGQNLTINWQNCTITQSEIDSKAISQGEIEMNDEGDAQMVKELEVKLKTIKTILTEKIECDLQEGKYRLPEEGTYCPRCRTMMPTGYRLPKKTY